MPSPTIFCINVDIYPLNCVNWVAWLPHPCRMTSIRVEEWEGVGKRVGGLSREWGTNRERAEGPFGNLPQTKESFSLSSPRPPAAMPP